jgi:hypothetical protein
MKITIQYFDGCPHWKLADERVREVLRSLSRSDVKLEYQLIDSAATADDLLTSVLLGRHLRVGDVVVGLDRSRSRKATLTHR